MKFAKAFILLIAGVMFSAKLYAQEETTDAAAEQLGQEALTEAASNLPSFGMGLEFGTVTINGTNYNTIHLQPDLKIGKFGIGLDVNFEFDANGRFRSEDWTGWQNILSKIMYLRWGQKFDKPVYVKIGNIDDFTIGHGLIMYRYSNMLNYPGTKTLGLAFDLDLGVFGMETMMGSLNFDVFGFRLLGRPLFNTKIPIVKSLEVGASLVMDVNPYALVDGLSNVSATNVFVYGGDLSAIVFDNFAITMKTYFDFVAISGAGTGEVLGVAGKLIKAIPYRFEVRLTQPRFLFSYFDSFYDSMRTYKYALLDTVTNGAAGMYFSSGVGLFPDEKTQIDRLVWTLAVEDSFSDEVLPTLTMELTLDKALLKKIGAKFTWIRQNIYYFVDVFKWQDANSILMLDLDYYISENLAISLNYKRTFEVGADGVIQPFTSTSISTKFSF